MRRPGHQSYCMFRLRRLEGLGGAPFAFLHGVRWDREIVCVCK